MAAITLAGCGPRPGSEYPVAPDRGDACLIHSGQAESSDTLTAVLTDSVDLGHAANPTNDSERFLFREIFETLIYIDCEGKVRPGLAASWSPDQAHRTWTFTMGGDPAEPGMPPAAESVVSTWESRPGALQQSGIESAKALGDGRLSVTFLAAQDSIPRILADPMLGLAHSRGSILGRGDRFLIVRRRAHAVPSEFRVEPKSDPRDALDRGADLLISRDPAVIDYVSSRAEFTTAVLPWSLTYVLIQSPGAQPIEAPFDQDSTRLSLARDAVRADARMAEPPFWWDQPLSCGSRPSIGPAGPPASRVVYPQGDAVARGLAERLVALAGGRTPLRAYALPSREFVGAVRAGSERAYIMPLPSRTLAPCRSTAGLPADARIEPLVETRATVILRRGTPDLTVDWDGTIRLVDPIGPRQ